MKTAHIHCGMRRTHDTMTPKMQVRAAVAGADPMQSKAVFVGTCSAARRRELLGAPEAAAVGRGRAGPLVPRLLSSYALSAVSPRRCALVSTMHICMGQVSCTDLAASPLPLPLLLSPRWLPLLAAGSGAGAAPLLPCLFWSPSASSSSTARSRLLGVLRPELLAWAGWRTDCARLLDNRDTSVHLSGSGCACCSCEVLDEHAAWASCTRTSSSCHPSAPASHGFPYIQIQLK